MRSSLARPLPSYFDVLGFVLFGLLGGATLLELTSWAVLSVCCSKGSESYEKQAASPAYAGATWAAEFWKEESSRSKSRRTYAPFAIWGVTRWHGKYVNNDESETGIFRRTVNPAGSACGRHSWTNVWVFGGSTVYGTGVPDWATLPSYLSRDLNDVGKGCVQVANFGVEGYVTNQELILLTGQLRTGRRPDVVIFYDGDNDAASAGPSPGPPAPHFYLTNIKARIEGSISGRLDFLRESHTMRLGRAIRGFLRPTLSSTLAAGELHSKAVAVLDNYEANLQLARALGQSYNFRVYSFWQPSLFYGHKPLVQFEQQLPEIGASAAKDPWYQVIRAVFQEAGSRAAAAEKFVFLGRLFESVKDPLYIDGMHLGPRGNELAAQAIAEYIKDQPEP